MLPFFLFLASSSLGLAHDATREYLETTQYIELSMDLTEMFKDLPEFNENEIHALAKTCVSYGENQKQLMKAYEAYLHNKSGEYQRMFTEKFILPRHITVVERKLQSLPGFYLTKVQIEKFREVLLEKKLTGVSVTETIASLKSEISKEIGEDKANSAIEMLVKDLKMIYKVHGNMIHQVDPVVGYLLHDEL